MEAGVDITILLVTIDSQFPWTIHLLRGLLGRRRSGFRVFLAIPLVEAIHASCRVNQLLFSCEKWMTGWANFHVQVVFFRRSSLKSLAACAANCDLVILRVNSWFHYSLTSHIQTAKTVLFQTNYDRRYLLLSSSYTKSSVHSKLRKKLKNKFVDSK